MKIHISQYIGMLKQNFDLFSLNFDRSYYLYRKMKIDQAYSLAKASYTDQWSSTMQARNEAPKLLGRARILKALQQISNHEEYYTQNIKHRVDAEFFYEDFCLLDKTEAYTTIFADLGITDFNSDWHCPTKKLRTQNDQQEISELKEYLLPSPE